MPGKIPSEFIDQLLSRIDIRDLVERRLSLRKSGRSYLGLCPFHHEKTPSFTVNPERQTYHCFGCGVHGTAISFLMELDRLSFPEAIEELAHQAGMEMPNRDLASPGVPDMEPLRRILEAADAYFRRQLRQHPGSQQAVDYLKGRGLSGEIAAEYGVGYAPPGWDGLCRELGGQGSDGLRLLVQAGLVVEQDGRQYDRFRNRIMFPIRDRRGRPIGFGGRVLGDDKPKYLNSPETPLFHKGRELYGLYEASRALRHIDRLLIVEGYLDVIALAQFGIRQAVATLGTATTSDHFERLFRATQELVFCFDGDQAGREAGWKALLLALPQAREGREIRFLFLPDQEDPDTLIRKEGNAAFAQRLTSAKPLSEYFFERLESEVDLASPEGRARLAERARPLLEQLPAGTFREIMVARLAERVGLGRRQLGLAANAIRARPTQPRGPATLPSMTQVRRAVALLLQYPHLAPEAASLSGHWRQLAQPGISLLAELLDLLVAQPTLNTAQMLERWRDTESGRHMERLASYPFQGDAEGLKDELLGAIRRLNQETRGQEANQLIQKERPSQMTAEEKARLLDLLKPS